MMIAKVVLPLPIRQCFKYFVPEMIYPIIGGRVVVPFRSRDIIGIVISIYQEKNKKETNLRYIKSFIDTKSLYTQVLLDLLKWISKNYFCPIGSVFFSVLPKLLRGHYKIKNKCFYHWIITKKGQEIDLKNFIKRKKQLNALLFLKKNSILQSDLKKYNLSKFILKKLEEQELCKAVILSRAAITKKKLTDRKKIFLNKNILDHINQDILIKKRFSSWLLTKINLCMKVKFYLKLIQSVLLENKQVLILVPYIKDTNTIAIFLKKFFNISVDIIHTELTNIQYLDNWTNIKNLNSSIVIGLSESVFLPFLNLGIIIILEEHHLNYKSIKQCRYNARDIGILRAYLEKIPVILDSDTPSLKTIHNIFLKKCFYIKIQQKYTSVQTNCNVINLKKERIKFGFSLTLINEINKNFQKKQVLFIFNQFNLFFLILICQFCRYKFICMNCRDYFEVNEYHNVLFCRFCLIKIKKPLYCQQCGNRSLIVKSIRVEEIKNIIKSIFPKKPLLFLLDKKIFKKNFSNQTSWNFLISKPYIIFTTEKILQNYYFPYAKLISLISIDNYFLSLNLHSIEYFAQFYSNLNKITGRKKNLLKVLVQTSFCSHLHWKKLYHHGYFSFVNKIIEIRKKFFLPPWSIQSIIYTKSSNVNNNIIFLHLFDKILKKKHKKYNYFLWCMGPNPCIQEKNKKKHIFQLLIHCSSRMYLDNLLHECIRLINFFSISKKVKWLIDVDPNKVF